MESELIQVLHDHHKDSFSHIRDHEKKRDQYFLLSIFLIGALFFEVNYPSDFLEALGQLTIFGADIDIASLPLGALLSITWTLHLVFTLRYCQHSLFVERQYDYLHFLEQKISEAIGDKGIYRREGAAYLEDYPPFTTWAWLFYVGVFPAIVFVSVIVLQYIEVSSGPYQWPYKLYDVLMAIGIIISYVLYRLVPVIRKKKA